MRCTDAGGRPVTCAGSACCTRAARACTARARGTRIHSTRGTGGAIPRTRRADARRNQLCQTDTHENGDARRYQNIDFCFFADQLSAFRRDDSDDKHRQRATRAAQYIRRVADCH